MIVLLLALLAGQETDPARLVDALGADAPAERDRASADLERLGDEARDALQAGAASSNPEVAGRCGDLLARLRALSLSTLRLRRVSSPFLPFGRADHFRVSPDGKFAVGHDLEVVRTWSLPHGAPIALWVAHPEGARNLALSPDGSRLLTWGFRGPALWEAPAGRLVRRYESLNSEPRAFVASPDGRRVGWASWDAVEWLDAATGQVLWRRDTFPRLRALTDLALSPDGRRLATIGANDRTLEVLDAKTGALLQSFSAPSTGSRSRVGFSRDGASLVATNPDHRKAWVYSTETGQLLQEAEDAEFDLLRGASARIRVVHPLDEKAYPGWTVVKPPAKPFADSPETAFLAEQGRTLVFRTLNGRTAHLHDAASGERIREIGAELNAIAPAPDGVLAGTRTGEAALFGLDGVEKARVRGGQGRVARVAFGGPGRVLWRDGAGVLRCSELATGRELWRREYFTLGGFAFALAPDGRHGAGDANEPGTGTNRLVRFDLADGREQGRYAEFRGYLAGVAFSPDGALLAASTRDGPLAVWEVGSRKLLWEAKPGKNARWLAFSPDSKRLFAGDDEGRVVRRTAATGEVEQTYLEPDKPVRHAALSPDARSLAVLQDAVVSLFDAEEGALRLRIPDAGHNGVGFHGAGLVAGGPVRFFDGDTGVPTASFPAARVRHAGVDDSRTRVAALLEDGRFVVVDLDSGKPVWERKAPPGSFGFLLGPRAGYAVFHGERGVWFKVLRPGIDEPEAVLEQAVLLGADAARSALFTIEGMELRRRDLRSLALKGAGPHRHIRALLPCGRAPWFLAAGAEGWFRLDPETLESIDGVPLPPRVDVLDAHPDGTLLLCSDGFRDSRSGRLRAALPTLLRDDAKTTFLSADGSILNVVTGDGRIFTYGPPP